MKTYLLLFTLLSLNLFAQKERTYYWYFGDRAGIEFSGGNPVILADGQIYAGEGCTSISDTAGNLLFYSNGEMIWNADHDTMFNGSNLLGCLSSSQGVIIIPKPCSNISYYVITADCVGGSNGLRYNEIDMVLDSGKGGVVMKNVFILDTVSEKVAAIKHNNGIDVWVLTHKAWTTEFYAYQVTSSGIDTTPIISSVGLVHNGTEGCMKFSPNGKKISVVQTFTNTVELFDFDDLTGIVSNQIQLPSDSCAYGVSFSPDNSKLYVSGAVCFRPSYIYQYDLSNYDSIDIVNSRTLIYSHIPAQPIASETELLTSMQIAPDGKIYVTHRFLTALGDSLGVINNPNDLGLSCNYIHNGLYVLGNKTIHGLPSFIESYFDTTIKYPNISNPVVSLTICDGDSIIIFSVYRKTAGIYYDSLLTITGCDSVLSTILTVNPIPIVSFSGLDPVYCSTDAGVTLIGMPADGSFSGTGGIAGEQFFPATGVGIYTVTYSYNDSLGCSNSISQSVSVVQCTGIPQNDRIPQIKIYPNPNTGQCKLDINLQENTKLNIVLYHFTGQLIYSEETYSIIGNYSQQIDLSGYAKGIYYVQIMTKKGVVTRKVIYQ